MTAAAGGVGGRVGDALGASVDALRAIGVDTPELDAAILLEAASGLDRASLVADPEATLTPAASRAFGAMVRRRLQREPVAYITGRRGFRNLDLKVDGRALIPRPETEMLVELALEVQPLLALDVGTGSGAIALALADELPLVEITATDSSPQALALARENAAELGLAERIAFVEGSFPPQSPRFDLLLANLPYIPEGDSTGLAPEILKYEPHSALFAGPTGLDAFEWLAAALAEGEVVAKVIGLEVGIEQAPAVAELLRRAGCERTEIRTDLAGIERVVVGWWQWR